MADAFTIRELAVVCIVCGAEIGEPCWPTDPSLPRVPLPYFHAARVEDAEFKQASGDPTHSHPITDEAIEKADVI